MPTYDYACRDCGHRFEEVQSIHDDSLTTCPECGGDLRRVVAPVGVHFKGSGFYRTDSRDAKKKTTSATSSGDTDSGSGKTTTGSESKDAPAPSAKPTKAVDSGSGGSSSAT